MTFSSRALDIDPEKTCLKIEEMIRTSVYVYYRGKGIVIGLSGGLDSAVSAALSVREIGADKVLGLHFFNPVPIMKLLEIVRTAATSEETLDTGKEFGQSLDKTIVMAQDTPGFIVNRLMVPQILNAIQMLESGVATKEDIDTGMTLGLNHPLGPLSLADLVGLDTILFIANGIHDKLRDAQYAAPASLKKMVAAGQLGRKTGKGFYEYR